MLKAQIAQKATFSSTPPHRLPNKAEPNPRKHCNYVTMKEGEENFIDPKDTLMKEGRKIIMTGNKERNNDGKTATFKENDTVEIPTIFPLKLPDLGSFYIPCIVGKVEIERGLIGDKLSYFTCLFHPLLAHIITSSLGFLLVLFIFCRK